MLAMHHLLHHTVKTDSRCTSGNFVPVAEHAHPEVRHEGAEVLNAWHRTNLRAALLWLPQDCVHQQPQIDQYCRPFGVPQIHLTWRKVLARPATVGLCAVQLQLRSRWHEHPRVPHHSFGEENRQLTSAGRVWVRDDALQAFWQILARWNG